MERIGYLGPLGSYSMLASNKLRPNAQTQAYVSFPQIFTALEKGEIDGAVIPIENTLNGGVLQNMDLMQEYDVSALEETTIKIDHRLAFFKGANLKNIKRIYSHSQALDQCSKYLSDNFSSAQLIPVNSTSASLEKILSPEDAGIVGSHIIKESIALSENNIADEDSNFTHFLLIRKGEVPKDAKSAKIYFSVTCKNRSGALLSFLQLVSNHGLNMTKIESRPIKNSPDEYRFFIEIEGCYSDTDVKRALKEIKDTANSFKLLGCY